MANSEIKKLIAQSIKQADRSLFNENYDRQAEAVVKGLAKAGYFVVPVQPDQAILDAGKEAMTAGRYRPNDILAQIYAAMVRAGKA